QGLMALAKWALRFSPVVCVDPASTRDTPDGLLLDVTGEDHLFGGQHLLLADLSARLLRMAGEGLSNRLAIAPTIGGAWALACYGPHPLSVVRASDTRGEEHGPGRAKQDEKEGWREEWSLREALTGLPVAALRISGEVREKLGHVGIERIGQLLRLPRE